MKKIRINREIFSDKSIKITMQAYKNHAVMTLSKKEKYIDIIFWKCKYDEDQTIKEFEAEVYLDDTVIGSGIGKTKKKAEQQAAYEAILLMNKQTNKRG